MKCCNLLTIGSEIMKNWADAKKRAQANQNNTDMRRGVKPSLTSSTVIKFFYIFVHNRSFLEVGKTYRVKFMYRNRNM